MSATGTDGGLGESASGMMGNQRHRTWLLSVIAILLPTLFPGTAGAISDTADEAGTRYRILGNSIFTYAWDPVSPPGIRLQRDYQAAVATWNSHDDDLASITYQPQPVLANLLVRFTLLEPETLATTGPFPAIGEDPYNPGWFLTSCASPCTTTFNITQPWAYENDPVVGMMDAESVALHEIGHVLGLGHSFGTEGGSGSQEPYSESFDGEPSMASGISAGVIRGEITRDDCTSAQFQLRNNAVCNFELALVAPTGNDPKYFGLKNGSLGSEAMYCDNPPGPATSACYWKMYSDPGVPLGDFGAQYDVYPAGTDEPDEIDTIRPAQRFRVRALLGTPTGFTGWANVDVCIYLRIDDSPPPSPQPYHDLTKACVLIEMLAGTNWTEFTTPWYRIPDWTGDGYERPILRTYASIGTKPIMINTWRIEREYS